MEQLVVEAAGARRVEPELLAEALQARLLPGAVVPLRDERAEGLSGLSLHGDDAVAAAGQLDQREQVGLARPSPRAEIDLPLEQALDEPASRPGVAGGEHVHDTRRKATCLDPDRGQLESRVVGTPVLDRVGEVRPCVVRVAEGLPGEEGRRVPLIGEERLRLEVERPEQSALRILPQQNLRDAPVVPVLLAPVRVEEGPRLLLPEMTQRVGDRADVVELVGGHQRKHVRILLLLEVLDRVLPFASSAGATCRARSPT